MEIKYYFLCIVKQVYGQRGFMQTHYENECININPIEWLAKKSIKEWDDSTTEYSFLQSFQEISKEEYDLFKKLKSERKIK